MPSSDLNMHTDTRHIATSQSANDRRHPPCRDDSLPSGLSWFECRDDARDVYLKAAKRTTQHTMSDQISNGCAAKRSAKMLPRMAAEAATAGTEPMPATPLDRKFNISMSRWCETCCKVC